MGHTSTDMASSRASSAMPGAGNLVETMVPRWRFEGFLDRMELIPLSSRLVANGGIYAGLPYTKLQTQYNVYKL